MEELIRLGLTDDDIKDMVSINEEILNLSTVDIKKSVELLHELNIDNDGIKNILIENPLFLNRTITDLKKLIKTLFGLDFSELNFLFENNPYLLNVDSSQIIEFFNKKKAYGMSKDTIIELIENNVDIFE